MLQTEGNVQLSSENGIMTRMAWQRGSRCLTVSQWEVEAPRKVESVHLSREDVEQLWHTFKQNQKG